MTHANADNVTLEAAGPLSPEIVGPLLHATDPHIFGFLHGHDEALSHRHMAQQWTQDQGIFSHVHAIAAMHEGRLMGLELGFDRATQDAHAGAFVAGARAFLTEAEFARLASWFEYGPFVIPPIPDGVYYLQNLAAVPEARGRGIGEKLLENCFERARAAGLARVHLDLFDGNPAFRLYQRVGMKTIVETRVPPLADEGIGLHLRMEIKL